MCNSGTWIGSCVSVSIVTCTVVTETDLSWLGLRKTRSILEGSWDGPEKPGVGGEGSEDTL